MDDEKRSKTKVQKISEFHSQRIEGLQRAIDEGTYELDASKVAKAILAKEKDLIPAQKDRDLSLNESPECVQEEAKFLNFKTKGSAPTLEKKKEKPSKLEKQNLSPSQSTI